MKTKAMKGLIEVLIKHCNVRIDEVREERRKAKSDYQQGLYDGEKIVYETMIIGLQEILR